MACYRILRRLALMTAVVGGLTGLVSGVDAQTAPAPATPAIPVPPSATPPVAAPPPAAANPSTAAPPATVAPPAAAAPPAASPPAAAAPPAAASPPAASAPDASPPDTSISQTMTLQPHPVVQVSGQSTWDEGFKTLNDSFTKLNETLAKANIKPTGNPMALFNETDDAGFKFVAMVPVAAAPDARPADLPADISFGQSPGGKVMKFQHRSAYDDIDSTYEAITAYLDEKGLEAKNMFAEEYLNRTKASDDNSLEVDIYVFLK